MSLHSHYLCLSRYAEWNVGWSKQITCGLTLNLQSGWRGFWKISFSFTSTYFNSIKTSEAANSNGSHYLTLFLGGKEATNDQQIENTFQEENMEEVEVTVKKRDSEKWHSAGPVRLLSVSLHTSLGRQCACLERCTTASKLKHCLQQLSLLRPPSCCNQQHSGEDHLTCHNLDQTIHSRTCRSISERMSIHLTTEVGWEKELQVQLLLEWFNETRRTGFVTHHPLSALLYQHFHFVDWVISDASVPWVWEIQSLGQRNALGHMT